MMILKNWSSTTVIFPMTIKNRLNTYHEQTQPLIGFYREMGILKDVDGSKSVASVFREIKAVLGES